jgi:hypothetical protein
MYVCMSLQEEENLAPPPTDAELNKPPQSLAGCGMSGLPPSQSLAGRGMGGMPPAAPGGLSNKYSRQVCFFSLHCLAVLNPCGMEYWNDL